ncbi:unnamed protein product [Echinostoma caproni]|uniref:Reverse transcriptase domain-containing protein n=1 Tax=Echinostoma caproni TaxID=27848 RepID=A0A183AVL3_9TREM|nr:unnamed protein product [Echinostoma caproni]
MMIQSDRQSDLEYADDLVLLSEDSGKLQTVLDSLDASAAMFGKRFAPSVCKMLLKNWVGTPPSFTLTEEVAGTTPENVFENRYVHHKQPSDRNVSYEEGRRGGKNGPHIRAGDAGTDADGSEKTGIVQ